MRRLLISAAVISALLLFSDYAEAKKCGKMRRRCYPPVCCQLTTSSQLFGTTTTSCFVQIDHLTVDQGSMEIPADRLSVPGGNPLHVYINSNVRGVLQGEFYQTVNGTEVQGTRMRFNPPIVPTPGQFRFTLSTFQILTNYKFHFADNLAQPTCQDQWDVVTVHP
ncbi:MAG: hypothetical protein JWM11_5431 [Planctomycetaceae bacterium]|nr:hypothetical protein [Planctomycetaceae bacterium]